MKIAFLGNMNNNHFSVVRYLRGRGVDAELLLYNNEISHFHPSCDSYTDDYKAYCKQLSWGSLRSLAVTSKRRIISDLKGYDILAGCGYAPAFLYKAGLSLDIFVPYGDDIWGATFYSTFLNPPYLAPLAFAVPLQRAGLKRCRIVHMNATNEMYEGQIQRYCASAARWSESLPMIQLDDYAPEKLSRIVDKTAWAGKFRELRAGNDLLVLLHARHSWKRGSADPNSKGTDRLFQAWALFRARHPKLKATLVTLEYGPDVEASKKLSGELGIEGSVEWLPMMQRKDLMGLLLMADIVCADFEHSWMTSGVLYEALVGAKPILATRDDSLYRKSFPDLYEIMNAREPIEIAARLSDYVAAPERFKAMGRDGRRWYIEQVVEPAIAKYLDYIASRAAQIS